MKRTGIILGILLMASAAHAQIWDELFNQDNTQTKYLRDQIAALQVYVVHVQKTYSIAKEGLGFIGKATKGEYDLHYDYFLSLRNVNPQIKGYQMVKDIIVLKKKISKCRSDYYNTLGEKKSLTTDEMDYVKQVFNRIEEDCSQILVELDAVTTSGNLEMKDDERIARVNSLYQQMLENFTIARGFGSGAVQLATSRNNAKAAVENSRILNNIKP